MNKNVHKVVGIFATLTEAHAARKALLNRGLEPSHMNLIVPDDQRIDKKIEPDSDGVVKEVVNDAFIGGAIGSGVGAVGAVAMAAASITLFAASPILAPLALMGFGAIVGANIGAGVAIGIKEDQFADMIRDVTNDGQYVLIVHTYSEGERNQAHDILAELVRAKPDLRST